MPFTSAKKVKLCFRPSSRKGQKASIPGGGQVSKRSGGNTKFLLVMHNDALCYNATILSTSRTDSIADTEAVAF